eukprot:NODE_125_length_18781_cov_0.243015.p10 type:complete len:139 gc:universal NODE_125_length_18781_cov_0.243015:9590-9174(-)
MTHCKTLFARPVHKLLNELHQFPQKGLQDFSIYSRNIQLLDMHTKLHANGLFQYRCVAKSCHLLLTWRYPEIETTVLRAEAHGKEDLHVRLLLEAYDANEKLEEEFVFIYIYDDLGLITKHIIQDRIPLKKPTILCLK